jgi:hypothetical protein
MIALPVLARRPHSKETSHDEPRRRIEEGDRSYLVSLRLRSIETRRACRRRGNSRQSIVRYAGVVSIQPGWRASLNVVSSSALASLFNSSPERCDELFVAILKFCHPSRQGSVGCAAPSLRYSGLSQSNFALRSDAVSGSTMAAKAHCMRRLEPAFGAYEPLTSRSTLRCTWVIAPCFWHDAEIRTSYAGRQAITNRIAGRVMFGQRLDSFVRRPALLIVLSG